MKVKVHFYILVDGEGNRQGWDVVKEHCDNVCLVGQTAAGKWIQYDSYEGYHSHSWAAEHGMTVECITKEVEI